MVSSLPPEILALVEFRPMEDVLLAILRADLPGVAVQSLLAADQKFPLVLPRRAPDFGANRGDSRFIDAGTITVHTFAEGVNGDEDAALLAEAVRVTLRDAANENRFVPDCGWLSTVEMTQAPRRVTDWATATGPVQYADLPTGVWRYETFFDVEVHKSHTRPFPLTTP